MNIKYEFEDIETCEEHITILSWILASNTQKLQKITITCVCGQEVVSEKNAPMSAEDQSDRDYEFMQKHAQCKKGVTA